MARPRLGRRPGPARAALRAVPRRRRPAARGRATPTSATAPKTRCGSATTLRRAAGRAPGYDGHCRDLTPDERAALAAEGRAAVVRFRTPDDGVSSFTDLIRGEVRVEWALIHDFVIVRSDGSPIFFLANAVDDIEMGITHVIRGEDLIDTTHRVLALRAALGGGDATGVRAPAADRRRRSRAKLSKRHGAVAVEDFAADGYLPEALLNYLALARLGTGRRRQRGPVARTSWSREFDLDRVTHAAAGFDRQEARLAQR